MATLTLADLLAGPPPPGAKKESAKEAPKQLTLNDLLAGPPPPGANPQKVAAAPKQVGPVSPEENEKSFQAAKTGFADNLSALTRLLSHVGFSATLTQQAKEYAEKQNQTYDDNQPGIQEWFNKNATDIGLAAAELWGASAVAELAGGGIVSALGGSEAALETLGPVAQGISKLANKNPVTKFIAQSLKAAPSGAAFGALTASPDENQAGAAAVGAILTPVGVFSGNLLGKLINVLSKKYVLSQMANEATAPVKEMEKTLQDAGEGQPLLLGEAIGSGAVKKEELNTIPEAKGFQDKSIENLNTIKKNLTEQSVKLGNAIGVKGEQTEPEIAKELDERIKEHSDVEQKKKRGLWKNSTQAAKKAKLKVKISSLLRTAKKEGRNMDKVYEDLGIGGKGEAARKVVESVVDKTDMKPLRKSLSKTIAKNQKSIDDAEDLLKEGNKRLSTKRTIINNNKIKLSKYRKEMLKAQDAHNKNLSSKAKLNKFIEKNKAYEDQKYRLDKHMDELKALRQQYDEPMKEARKTISDLGKENKAAAKKLFLTPENKEVDLGTADLARHYLNEKWADAKSSGNKDLARVYNSLLKGLKKDISQALDNAPQEVKDAHEAAMTHYKDKIAPLLEDPIKSIIDNDFDADKIASTFLPLTAASKGAVNRLNQLIDNVPGTAKLLLKHAVRGTMEETKTKDLFISPGKLANVFKYIGNYRLPLLLNKSFEPEKSAAVGKEIDRYMNNMKNGQDVFERMFNPNTGQKNNPLGVFALVQQYLGNLINFIGSKNLTGAVAYSVMPLQRMVRWNLINDPRKTLEKIIEIKKGIKQKDGGLKRIGDAVSKTGKPVGLGLTGLINSETD